MKKIIIFIGIIIIAGISWLSYFKLSEPKPDYTEFAKCITEKKAVFYGAFWCPHCQNTKKAFGKAVKFINYIECSTADGRGQKPECAEKNIQGYPTWIFGDGTKIEGEASMEKIAEKTNCELPKTTRK